MCFKKQRRFDCRPQTAPDGRRFVADALHEWGLDQKRTSGDSFDDLLLAAGELLANAIQACGTEIDVVVTGHCDHVEVSVSDDCPRPAVPGSAGPQVESGRGLQIVSILCSEWGQTSHDGKAKRVWCRVPVDEPTEAITTGCQIG